MIPAYVNSFDFSFFSDAKQQLNTMVSHLSSNLPLTQEHGTIEQYIHHEGHELLRRLLQAHLELRASQESRQDNLVNQQGKRLTHCRENTKATLTSLFGDVKVIR
jgi:predicted ATP-dependent protease